MLLGVINPMTDNEIMQHVACDHALVIGAVRNMFALSIELDRTIGMRRTEQYLSIILCQNCGCRVDWDEVYGYKRE